MYMHCVPSASMRRKWHAALMNAPTARKPPLPYPLLHLTLEKLIVPKLMVPKRAVMVSHNLALW